MLQLPEGFTYRPEFLSIDEEKELITHIERGEWSEVRMHGVVARRRVAHFGWLYGYESWKLTEGPPIPGYLVEVRERLAELAGVAPEELAEALVTEYAPGAGIGWHRDAPMFGVVAAVSLSGRCRMRFQRGKGTERETRQVDLEPRSAYVLAGEARKDWQHSIPATKELRYSVTFRTLRARRSARRPLPETPSHSQ